SVLVVGGAGYIGSHVVRALQARGCATVVLDNLSAGHRQAVRGAPLIVADVADAAVVRQTIEAHAVDAVMHFASFIQVGESVAQPGKYYDNNVARTIALLNTLAACGVRHFIFSSTAAIFGEPQADVIDERHPQRPINPYGRSKWLVEQLLPDYERAHGLRSVCLRYFNAAGAHPDASLGEAHDPETHLIPLAIGAALGQRGALSVFGQDFPTPDGTCIRDYIHVVDLAQAHILALDYLRQGGASAQMNLGNGTGYSVMEVIAAVQAAANLPVPCQMAGRRAGDPARLVASADKARALLGWTPQYAQLSAIVSHALAWHRKYPAFWD
ncbi:MAG: UDP-glucose 4-epimerase GalE, partial [Burkholderiaceae bacterium]|nr:UDP-glucose 4-epimerase GalE [Burkholderiaceae bacterium]